MIVIVRGHGVLGGGEEPRTSFLYVSMAFGRLPSTTSVSASPSQAGSFRGSSSDALTNASSADV